MFGNRIVTFDVSVLGDEAFEKCEIEFGEMMTKNFPLFEFKIAIE